MDTVTKRVADKRGRAIEATEGIRATPTKLSERGEKAGQAAVKAVERVKKAQPSVRTGNAEHPAGSS